MKKKTKKRIRNSIIILILIAGALFLFRGSIYRITISYKEEGTCKNYKVKDKNLATYIESNIPSDKPDDIEAIIDLSQDITAKALDFSLDSREADPNKTVLLGRSNCVGYASFAAATGNYLIDKYKLGEVWQARPVKGKLFLLGYELHKKMKDKSYKDHDFVIFTNKITKKEICIDPTLYDKSGIERITKQ